MNRLLQGDVGSGKTVVAAVAAYIVFLNGYQSALMAPTEILALQHFKTLNSILKPLGVRVSLRTSSTKKDEPFDILIGTHALIARGAGFKKLAFAAIDEQHRFGVEQRARLRHKGQTPHILTMTATPIPRSLALTLYGDLEVSSLDELPKNRKTVKTFVVPPEKRARAYQFIGDNISKGRQAFIIFPFIEPSETLTSVKAAKAEYEYLQKEIFPDLSIGLLHGRLKSEDKKDETPKDAPVDLGAVVAALTEKVKSLEAQLVTVPTLTRDEIIKSLSGAPKGEITKTTDKGPELTEEEKKKLAADLEANKSKDTPAPGGFQSFYDMFTSKA